MTNEEATVKTTRLFEPVICVANDDLVEFDFAPVAKPDGQVAVGRVVVPASSRSVSN